MVEQQEQELVRRELALVIQDPQLHQTEMELIPTQEPGQLMEAEHRPHHQQQLVMVDQRLRLAIN